MSKRKHVGGAIRSGRFRFAIGFAAYFVALWLLWDTPVVYPLKIFVVLLHEVSHGIAAVAGGGAIQEILITPNQGGACNCHGGVPFLTLSAGYLGSLLWGAALAAIVLGWMIPVPSRALTPVRAALSHLVVPAVAAGVGVKIDLLDDKGRSGAEQIIVFLTDGSGTYTSSGSPGSPADRAADEG